GLAGSTGSSDGTGSNARFLSPLGVAVSPTGDIYVADANNHTIRKIAPSGTVSTVAGAAGVPGYVDGVGTTARFHQPYGVAVDSAGNVFVVDTGNSLIRKITPSASVTTVSGLSGVLSRPSAVAVD